MKCWLTFDCYGTLIDWLAGLQDAYSSLLPGTDAERSLRVHRAVEPIVQEEGSLTYREVLSRCHEAVAAVYGRQLQTDREAVADSVGSWPSFPEVSAALTEAREDGWHIAILSNTDQDLLTASLTQIGVPIDATITSAETGSYKPAPRHWEAFFERTGVDATHHVHVAASIFHDIAPTARLGLNSIWINRTGATNETPRSAELRDMTGLVKTLRSLPGLRAAG